jgi:hypothetical protein
MHFGPAWLEPMPWGLTIFLSAPSTPARMQEPKVNMAWLQVNKPQTSLLAIFGMGEVFDRALLVTECRRRV